MASWGVMAAMQFSIWFFMGIEGTALAAGECRSPNRSLPVGAMVGLATLLVSGLITWFVCSGLMDTGTLGSSVYPLYEAALATGKLMVAVVLFIGSLLPGLASVNGCINDASHAWHSMSEDWPAAQATSGSFIPSMALPIAPSSFCCPWR